MNQQDITGAVSKKWQEIWLCKMLIEAQILRSSKVFNYLIVFKNAGSEFYTYHESQICGIPQSKDKNFRQYQIIIFHTNTDT